MAEIIEASSNERIFYLPDFIYFVQTTPFHHPDAANVFVRRILEILILFDRILIPAEHINISTSLAQVRFKSELLHHRTIQELIDRQRIITTIWSACTDIQEHLEATERYKRTVDAKYLTSSAITSQLEKLEVFKRNQAKQSQSALEFAKQNGWCYGGETELLSYNDGKILIPFSHENLLIGKGKETFTDERSVLAAKLAYINAMPSGNGGIYRSLTPDIELVMGETGLIGEDRLPPAFFTRDNLRALLAATGLNVPFDLTALLHKDWIPGFLAISGASDYAKYKNVIFKALEKLAERVTISSDKEAKEKMKLIQFVRPFDISAIGAKYIKPLAWIQRFSEYFRGTYQESFEWLPARPVRRLNRLANSLRNQLQG